MIAKDSEFLKVAAKNVKVKSVRPKFKSRVAM